MTVLTINVSSDSDLLAAVTAGQPIVDVHSFPTWEALHATLTPKRVAIIQALQGRGTLGMREVARSVGRDIKGVHTDLTALVNCGLLDRSGDGVSFPYDGLHVDFSLARAAA
ncbi:transcriptional regulator [Rhizobium wenxiniae]|uniref:HVO_A0114 family putative DNA-binding protein n=1 Tax=Rhizobium wenxiniae TaxID=1737357 RepID=UPI003C1BB0D3